MSVKHVKEEFKEYLLSKPNVQAVGVGFKNNSHQLSIIVSVDRKLDEVALKPHEMIPREILGVSTDVVEVGSIKALSFTDKVRPLEAGNSIGHYQVTAGTLGCFVVKDGEIVLLSNNHVLANTNLAKSGDPIYQPGKYDGGLAGDTVARLLNFAPISLNQPECKFAAALSNSVNKVSKSIGSQHRVHAYRLTNNMVDAAIASLDVDFVPEVREIGMPSGEKSDPPLDLLVQKTGRTTEYTTGKITQLHTTVRINYGSHEALFEDQIVMTPVDCKHFSQPGDSGSAIFDMEKHIVGLLFAGSDTVTIANPWRAVKSALGIELLVQV